MPATAPPVTYRLAQDADFPLLIAYREECGWGSAALQRNWSDPDRIFCVFMAELDGVVRDVGMGCWYMHQPDDLELANRETGVVHLASLFIAHRYQGKKIGTAAIDLLERVAVLEMGAKSLTLDTTAYLTIWDETHFWREEDKTKPGVSVAWYKARGYTQFRENRPLFLQPTPTDPDRLLTAIFLKKTAEQVRAEQNAA